MDPLSLRLSADAETRKMKSMVSNFVNGASFNNLEVYIRNVSIVCIAKYNEIKLLLWKGWER